MTTVAHTDHCVCAVKWHILNVKFRDPTMLTLMFCAAPAAKYSTVYTMFSVHTRPMIDVCRCILSFRIGMTTTVPLRIVNTILNTGSRSTNRFRQTAAGLADMAQLLQTTIGTVLPLAVDFGLHCIEHATLRL